MPFFASSVRDAPFCPDTLLCFNFCASACQFQGHTALTYSADWTGVAASRVMFACDQPSGEEFFFFNLGDGRTSPEGQQWEDGGTSRLRRKVVVAVQLPDWLIGWLPSVPLWGSCVSSPIIPPAFLWRGKWGFLLLCLEFFFAYSDWFSSSL